MPKSIDGIMQDLRVEVHKYVMLPQQAQDPTSGLVSLGQLRQSQVVNSHLPIGWPTMPRNVLHKFVAYAKKVMRRLLRWYINPLVDQQNRFNAAVVTAISDQSKAWGPFEQRIADLEAKVNDLTVAVESLTRKLPVSARQFEDARGSVEQPIMSREG